MKARTLYYTRCELSIYAHSLFFFYKQILTKHFWLWKSENSWHLLNYYKELILLTLKNRFVSRACIYTYWSLKGTKKLNVKQLDTLFSILGALSINTPLWASKTETGIIYLYLYLCTDFYFMNFILHLFFFLFQRAGMHIYIYHLWNFIATRY